MLASRSLEDLWVRLHHRIELPGVGVLKAQVLAVGPVAHEDRILAFIDRTEHIGTQDGPVRHRDGHVVFDQHAVGLRDACVMLAN